MSNELRKIKRNGQNIQTEKGLGTDFKRPGREARRHHFSGNAWTPATPPKPWQPKARHIRLTEDWERGQQAQRRARYR